MTFQSGKQKYRVVENKVMYDCLYLIEKQTRVLRNHLFFKDTISTEWVFFAPLRLTHITGGDRDLQKSNLYNKGMLRQLLPEIKEYVRTVERKKNMNLEFTLDDEVDND